MARDTVLGIDIGSTTIKAASLIQGQSGYAAQMLAIEPIGGGSIPVENQFEEAERSEQEKRAERRVDTLAALEALVKHNKIRKGTRCALSLGGDAVAPRTFNFPGKFSPDELERAVDLEAVNELPFPKDQALLDFQEFDNAADDRTIGVYVGVRREIIDDLYEMVRSVGLEPVIVDTDGLALANAFLQAGGGEPPQKETLVVNIGHRTTNLAVITPSGHAFIRDIPDGGASLTRACAEYLQVDLAQAETIKAGPQIDEPNLAEHIEQIQPYARAILESGMQELLNQIRDSIGFFITQHLFSTVEEAWITGGAANFPGLPEYLGEIFHVPTFGWNVLSDVNLQFVPEGSDPARTDAIGPRFAVALGLAMRYDVV